MKIVEASRKFPLIASADPMILKDTFLARLAKVMKNVRAGEDPYQFNLTCTTGDPDSLTSNARLVLNVDIRHDNGLARLLVSGHVHMARAQVLFYSALLVAIILVSLSPGFIEAKASGGAVDALVFLFVGGFILYDMHGKLQESGALLEAALESLETELGA